MDLEQGLVVPLGEEGHNPAQEDLQERMLVSVGQIADGFAGHDALAPTVSDSITAEIIKAGASGKGKLVANYGVGVNHIDISFASHVPRARNRREYWYLNRSSRAFGWVIDAGGVGGEMVISRISWVRRLSLAI